MKLNAEQIELIKNEINEGKITLDTLRDDILDHLCCVVEIKISKGEEFEKALGDAIQELAPDGLDEIQRETVFLLNSKKIIRMKKVMYAVGLISAIAFVCGWVFGILHLPGAVELSTYGFMSFVFLFLPMLAIDYYKATIHKALSEKLRIAMGLLSGGLVGLSLVFKGLHLQWAEELLITGALVFSFGFLPFLFFSMYKRSIS